MSKTKILDVEEVVEEVKNIVARLQKGERSWVDSELSGTSYYQESVSTLDKEAAEATTEILSMINNHRTEAYNAGYKHSGKEKS